MLDNRDELLGVLEDDPRRIGKVFARHAYGMRRWVDLFSVRVALTDDPPAKQLLGVYREVGGCPTPAVVREDVGAPNRLDQDR